MSVTFSTQDGSYVVESAAHLQAIATGGVGATGGPLVWAAASYIQTADIDYDGYADTISGFSGTYDGGGFRISNVHVVQGLFATTLAGSVIKNVTLDGEIRVTTAPSSSPGTGALVGYGQGTVVGCALRPAEAYINTAYNYCGGLCGRTAVVVDCVVAPAGALYVLTSANYAGGVTGLVSSGAAALTVTGNVFVRADKITGGIIGQIGGGVTTLVTGLHCALGGAVVANSGNGAVNNDSYKAGGVVGQIATGAAGIRGVRSAVSGIYWPGYVVGKVAGGVVGALYGASAVIEDVVFVGGFYDPDVGRGRIYGSFNGWSGYVLGHAYSTSAAIRRCAVVADGNIVASGSVVCNGSSLVVEDAFFSNERGGWIGNSSTVVETDAKATFVADLLAAPPAALGSVIKKAGGSFHVEIPWAVGEYSGTFDSAASTDAAGSGGGSVTWTTDGQGRYEVASAAHFACLADAGGASWTVTGGPADYRTASYVQTADIDYTGRSETVSDFAGDYDGAGRAFSNVSVVTGLFASTLRGSKVHGMTVTGTARVTRGPAAWGDSPPGAGIILGAGDGDLYDCVLDCDGFVDGKGISGLWPANYVGGLAGTVYRVYNCRVADGGVAVTGHTGNSQNKGVAAIAGKATIAFDLCVDAPSMQVDGYVAAGVVGDMYGPCRGAVARLAAVGSQSARTAGGAIGYARSKAPGAVRGILVEVPIVKAWGDYAGGIVGRAYGDVQDCVFYGSVHALFGGGIAAVISGNYDVVYVMQRCIAIQAPAGAFPPPSGVTAPDGVYGGGEPMTSTAGVATLDCWSSVEDASGLSQQQADFGTVPAAVAAGGVITAAVAGVPQVAFGGIDSTDVSAIGVPGGDGGGDGDGGGGGGDGDGDGGDATGLELGQLACGTAAPGAAGAETWSDGVPAQVRRWEPGYVVTSGAWESRGRASALLATPSGHVVRGTPMTEGPAAAVFALPAPLAVRSRGSAGPPIASAGGQVFVFVAGTPTAVPGVDDARAACADERPGKENWVFYSTATGLRAVRHDGTGNQLVYAVDGGLSALAMSEDLYAYAPALGAVVALPGGAAEGAGPRVSLAGVSDLAAVPGGAVAVAGAAVHLLGTTRASLQLPDAGTGVLVGPDEILVMTAGGVVGVTRPGVSPDPALSPGRPVAGPGVASGPVDWTDPWVPALGTTPGQYCWRTGTHWTFDDDVLEAGDVRLAAAAATVGAPKEAEAGFLWSTGDEVVRDELGAVVTVLGGPVVGLSAARGTDKVAWATAGAVGLLGGPVVFDAAAHGYTVTAVRATPNAVYAATAAPPGVVRVDLDGSLWSWSEGTAGGALVVDRTRAAVRLARPAGDDEEFPDAEMPPPEPRMWAPGPGLVAWLPWPGALLQVGDAAPQAASSPAARAAGTLVRLVDSGDRVLAELPAGVSVSARVRYPRRGGSGGTFVVGADDATGGAAGAGVLVRGGCSVKKIFVAGRDYDFPWTVPAAGPGAAAAPALARGGVAVLDPAWTAPDADVPLDRHAALEVRGAVAAESYGVSAPDEGDPLPESVGVELLRMLSPTMIERGGEVAAGVDPGQLEAAVEALWPGHGGAFVHTDVFGYKSVNYMALAGSIVVAARQLQQRSVI